MAGLCDEEQYLCLGLALWNGVDPILKERMFGLTNSEGNHGEDVKEQWWYVDATPTSSWLSWRYHYPRTAFPYEDLVSTNGSAAGWSPEYEIADTGVLDGCWAVDARRRQGRARRPAAALHRDQHRPRRGDDPRAAAGVVPQHLGVDRGPPPAHHAADAPSGEIAVQHSVLGAMTLSSSGSPQVLFCDNETNTARLLRRGRAGVPEGRHQRPRRVGRGHGQPRATPAPRRRSGTC